MTIWDLLRPWRAIRRRDIAERSLDKAHAEIVGLRAEVREARDEFDIDKGIKALKTELLQTQRTGYDDLAKDLGCSVEDIMDGKIEPMLHDDPQAVYRALDNATASEVKFRQVKDVNRELRLVIRQIIQRVAHLKMTAQVRQSLFDAALYGDQPPQTRVALEKPLTPKRKTLRLNHPPKDKDDEAQAQAETKA